MPSIIIASTGPRMGKTAFVAALSSMLGTEKNVVNVHVMKDHDRWEKDQLNLNLLLSDHKGCLTTKQNQKLDKGLSIVEGSDDVKNNLSFAEKLDAVIILISKYGDDITKFSDQYGSRLLGVVVNNVSKHRIWSVENDLRKTLESKNITLLGWVPDDRTFLAPSIADVVQHLDGEYLTNENTNDKLLDHFLIGGLVLDWGPSYFSIQDRTGVVVRGDRPDIQLAALQTETTRAMILTKGVRPVEYVYYEAEQVGIPLIVVSGSTHDVTEKLENLQEKIEFNHPEKLGHMINLLEANIDVDTIRDALIKPATR